MNPDGTRNREFRPLIQEEWLNRSVTPYNPNGNGYSYGLYSGSQPTCGPFKSVWKGFEGSPAATIDSYGRLRSPGYNPSYSSLRSQTAPPRPGSF